MQDTNARKYGLFVRMNSLRFSDEKKVNKEFDFEAVVACNRNFNGFFGLK